MKKTILACVASTLIYAVAIAPGANIAGPIPAIPWLHEGLVITSTWMAAYVPGNSQSFHEDINGQWQDAYGNTFSETDLHGTSGSGVSEIVITCINHDSIVGSSQGYGDVRAVGLADPMPLQNGSSFVTPIGQDTETWIDPAHLAAAKSDGNLGTVVEPVQWKLSDGVHDAIRIARVTSDGYSDHVYDRKTGLLLHYATSTKSAPTPQYLPAGQVNQGDTTLTQGDFIAFHDINVPWSHEDMPAWIGQFKALHFGGQVTFRNSPLPQVPNHITLDLTSEDHGDGWMRVNSSTVVAYQNMAPLPAATGPIASGRCQFGGLWAGPKALAALHQGDVLDEDPITKMRTVVTQISDQSVTISESNNSGEVVNEYDKQSGMLIATSFYTAVSKQDWAVRLQSQE
jgi:hypothetical protein